MDENRPTRRFVSRAGLKLDAALEAFGLDVHGLICADFGCNVGGFTDCLLQREARKVFAVDTGYGALAWTLRQDERVTVMERTNALRAEPPELVDLVVVDVAWTPQALIVPAAAKWLAPGGKIVSLLKPHYEIAKAAPRGARKPHGPIDDDRARAACLDTCAALTKAGLCVAAVTCSPLRGKGGNMEFLLLIRPAASRER